VEKYMRQPHQTNPMMTYRGNHVDLHAYPVLAVITARQLLLS
jgi:hypothetical protein